MGEKWERGLGYGKEKVAVCTVPCRRAVSARALRPSLIDLIRTAVVRDTAQST